MSTAPEETEVGAALRVAHLLTRDPGHATRLVAGALARRTDDVPAATARDWVAGRGRTRAPAVVRVDGGTIVDVGDLWDRIALLPRPQQAALVLRHEHERSLGELARLLGREDVGRDVDAAEATLGHPDPAVLAQLLDAHAQDVPDASVVPAFVERLLTRRRRTRSGVLALAAAVALTAVVVPLSRQTTVVPGLASAVPLASPAPYYGGGRLIGTATTGDGSAASVTFTPTGTAVTLLPSCQDVTATTSTGVGGGGLMFGSCSGSTSFGAGSAAGIFPAGRSTTVTLTRTSGTGPAQLAVYQGVPRAEYVFPPQPAVREDPPVQGAVVTSAAAAGANGTTTADVAVRATSQLSLGTSAPGELTVSADGVVLATAVSWDWTPALSFVDLSTRNLAFHGIAVAVGQPITVQVRTSGFTVPGWAVSAS